MTYGASIELIFGELKNLQNYHIVRQTLMT